MQALKPFDLQPHVLEQILGLGVKKTYERGYLFMEGHLSSNLLFFVEKGAMRNFLFADGIELTNWISTEGEFSCRPNFFTGLSDQDFLEALEPLQVIEIRRDQLHLAYQRTPALEHFGRLLAEYQLSIFDRNYLIISEKSAWKRYQMFLECYPHLNGRVSLKYIASLLKLDQATLSRVRAKGSTLHSVVCIAFLISIKLLLY